MRSANRRDQRPLPARLYTSRRLWKKPASFPVRCPTARSRRPSGTRWCFSPGRTFRISGARRRPERPVSRCSTGSGGSSPRSGSALKPRRALGLVVARVVEAGIAGQESPQLPACARTGGQTGGFRANRAASGPMRWPGLAARFAATRPSGHAGARALPRTSGVPRAPRMAGEEAGGTLAVHRSNRLSCDIAQSPHIHGDRGME